MMMRKVGLGLGLGLGLCGATASARNKIISIRRSLTSSSSSVGLVWNNNKDEKSLYLCFIENSRRDDENYTNQVVRPIRLFNNTTTDHDKEICLLEEAAYSSSTTSKLNMAWSLCSRLGSHIVFPTGPYNGRITHFSRIDTSTSRNIQFQKSETSFSTPKHNPRLGELNGKLYCVDACPYLADPKLSPFEVLDPENEELGWRPLDPPPFINALSTNNFDVSFLEESNKILGWEPDKTGVYCFDTANPQYGWRESSFSLGNALPFLKYRRPPVFIRDHHPVLGDFHLMFIYDHIKSLVNPFFMSDQSDSFGIVEHGSLRLSNLCHEYNDFTDYTGFDSRPVVSTDFEFVPLGNRKVCLVLNKSFPHDHDDDDNDNDHLRDTRNLLLITFDYKIKSTTFHYEPTIEITTGLLSTRRFRYHSRQPDRTKTNEVGMAGVFLL